MDVTCERCGTEYDFDDALVSERGTTVKCTNCGAQFRVYRPVPATGPERWVVRTVDGRELVFSALRELQAAISTGVVGRDDVLSRGGGRPRRLGSIAELEPFFKQAIVVAATSTAPGLGIPSARVPGRQDLSQAIPLPRDPVAAAWSGASPSTSDPPRRSGTLPPPPPVLHGSGDRSEVRARSAGDPIHTSVTGSMQPTSVAAAPAARLQNLVAADLAEPVTIPRADPRQSSDRTPAVPIGPMLPQAPAVVTSRAAMPDATIADNAPAFADTIAAISETMTQVDGSAVREQIEQAEAVPPPARKPEESGVVERRAGPFQLPPLTPPPERAQRSKPPLEGRMRTASIPPITPTPGEARGSYIPEPEPSVSPRFSMVQSQKRSSSVRWIVGVVLVGATALLAATVGRKYFVAPPPAQTAAPAADDRVTKLVEDGDKLLREGDLDGAKEKYDKASALAENDPVVTAHLAHLAVVRADQRWLKVRLLPSGPEQSIAQAELADSIEKMKKAVEAAQKLASGDAAVRRYRVDALRIAGDRAGARALVAEMTAAGKTSDDDLSLAALDLAEEKPAWPTVIDRLRSAVAVDGNLGRARAMLVYALATSGDIAGAKAEHERLKSLTPPHPLTVALLAYMANVEIARGATSGTPVATGAPKTAGNTPVPGANSGANSGASGSGAGTKPPGGRVADDYVAPNAGTVDISDMGGHAPPPPPSTQAPPPQSAPPTTAPAPAPKPPPGVDTSDLPGFGK